MNEEEMIHYEDELFEELSKNKIKRTDILTDLNVTLQEYQRLAANIKDVREIQEYKIAVVSVESELKELQRENQQLKDNWNKLKEFIVKEYYMYLPLEANTKSITILIDKMQELEQGSDRNVED